MMTKIQGGLLATVLLGLLLAAMGAAGAAEPSPAAEATASLDPATPQLAPVPRPDEDFDGFARALIERVQRSEWLPVFGFGLMLISWGIRAGFKKLGAAWATTKIGGRAIAFGSSLLLTAGMGLAGNKALSIGLLSTAAAAAWVASGQWEDKKDATQAGKSEPAKAAA